MDRKILAIESSHDDSSMALYKGKKIIWEKTISQTNFHEKFGGTVPEYAAREHLKNLPLILKELNENHDLKTIDYVAYTKEPGLVGSLHMGALLAKAIGHSLNKKVIPINHMHGHIFSVEFNHKIEYPALSLIVSGGHTQLWLLNSPVDLTIIGETTDDAIGEVYDKVARALKLGFPGGPIIDKCFSEYNGKFLDFGLGIPSEIKFSFSGLKTKVLNYINNNPNYNPNQVAASFQHHAINNLILVTQLALDSKKINSLLLGGGVSANIHLRQRIFTLHEKVLIPEIKYTTDNASMIALRADILLKTRDN